MHHATSIGTRTRTTNARLFVSLAFIAGGLIISFAIAQCYAGNDNSNGGNSGSGINKVEEDWELDLNAPDSDLGSPQLTLLMSPTGSTTGLYSVFQVNQRTVPNGRVGGLQLQLWNGQTLLAIGDVATDAALATTGEKVQWTHRQSLGNNGNFTDEIVGLSSSTWGNFGSNTTVTSTSTSTNMVNLNGYDPNVTIANSGIDFGNTRVGKLILRKVRTYTGNQKSVEQAMDRVIYQY